MLTRAISDKTDGFGAFGESTFYSATVISKALKIEVINNVYDVTIQQRRNTDWRAAISPNAVIVLTLICL